MSMRESLAVAAALAALSPALAGDSPALGVPVTAQDVVAWDISVGPKGEGLPRGSGAPAQGRVVYEEKCLPCHGERGAGKPNDPLVGGMGTLRGDQTPVKTVGSYWPYATTIFDYVRRAMPFNAPKSLTDDEVYAVTAYLLHLNGVIGDNEIIDAESLPRVKMPNRDGFAAFVPGR